MNDDITIFGTISTGGAIRRLQGCSADKPTCFDFCGLVPTTLHSYRGIGKTYSGYKGGTYRMREDSPLWVANYGQASGTQITNIVEIDWCVLIVTRNEGAP